jgi:DNA-binding CsgD family transcriptional regulator
MVFKQALSRFEPRGPLDPDSMVVAMPALLAIYEATLSQDIDAFEAFALRSLGRLVGFDGAVWGSGVVAPGPVAELCITRASVIDRPATLLGEYAEVAPHDPVTANFLACPDQAVAIAVDVEDYYRTRSSSLVGEYLQRHRIAHLLLLGCGDARSASRPQARRWITAYRESARPFDRRDVARLQTLLPLWSQAHRLCLVRHMERLARSNSIAGAAVALCDRSGLIHAAEPSFSDLTALRDGDTIAGEVLAQLRGPVHAAVAVNGMFLRVQGAGPWVLLQATREGASAALSLRERQVARHYVDGLSYKEIARELGSSPSTVRTQLQSIYRRLGVHSRVQLQRTLTTRDPA